MGFPSVLPLRSEALTTRTVLERSFITPQTRAARRLRPRRPVPQGTPARLRAQLARRVRATRRAQLPWRRWCAHARRRERGRE